MDPKKFTQLRALEIAKEVFTLLEQRKLGGHETFAICALMMALAGRVGGIPEEGVLKAVSGAIGVVDAMLKTPKEALMQYLIWSIEHRGWWKKSLHGYTTRTDLAGRFPEMEARSIVMNANRFCVGIETNEIMVPAPSLDQIKLDQEYPDR